MHYYRLYENIPERTALGSGTNGGRWNHTGIQMIYTSNSATLTMMEIYSIKGPVVSIAKWILATLEVPDEIAMLDIGSLPVDWNKRPHSTSTKNFGTIWANEKKSLSLMVPSARIPLSCYPKEHNVLLNPRHPEFDSAIKVVSTEEINFQINRF